MLPSEYTSGVCRAGERLLRKTQKGMPPFSHINFKPRGEEAFIFRSLGLGLLQKKSTLFFVVLSKSTNNTDGCLFRSWKSFFSLSYRTRVENKQEGCSNDTASRKGHGSSVCPYPKAQIGHEIFHDCEP